MRTYLLYWPDGGETEADAREVQGVSAEDAAARHAQHDDERWGCGAIVNGVPATYMVREKGGADLWVAYEVRGEMVPRYTARAVKP